MDNFDTPLVRVYNEYARNFIARAYNFTGCMDTAEDVVQDVYVELSAKLKNGEVQDRGGGHLTWSFYQLIRWRCLDRIKRKRNRVEISFSFSDYNEDNNVANGIRHHEFAEYEQELFRANQAEDLEELIEMHNTLSPLEKKIVMKYREGYKIREIAKTFKMSARQVTNGKQRALHKLKEQITKTKKES